ncbi:transcriptional regulator, AraC family [Solidesulfovibrio fructosivorans JJ]]|uniref:Transcriptional regulator, AraC family n=1 Tax=Solidesulfovibrio fructosivorans JJ] TaxID=596151 RepID=E1JSQ0_SOLFR|nr:AraC family transcriptional regulator [Solidesulfovibrio fructosivorans]EFL52533.1 transcriptional regulator, AraC family [Solidesulfovibrio fructosivorans JJ]]
MPDGNNLLDVDSIYIPLSPYRYFETNSPDDVNAALSENFRNGHIDVVNKKKFKMIYNHVKIGHVSFNAAASSAGFHIHAAIDIKSFVLIFVTHGRLEARIKGKTSLCIPDKLASLLDFDQPSVIAVEPFYNNMTVRFARVAVERMLEKLTGKPLRHALRFANQIDLSQPGPKRLLAIINQVAALYEHDTALAQEPLLVGQYEQLLLTALLTCLEHNARGALLAPPLPAPPKVVALVENFLEANADKPLNLGDLADLTNMSARSIQLAFKKHRGYSPSRFLRECRLSRARDLLRCAAPGTSVLSVSLACGFASQSLFSRLYRERFGEKPSESVART